MSSLKMVLSCAISSYWIFIDHAVFIPTIILDGSGTMLFSHVPDRLPVGSKHGENASNKLKVRTEKSLTSMNIFLGFITSG